MPGNVVENSPNVLYFKKSLCFNINMQKIFNSIIDIRKGEIAITVLMLAYYYLILVTYYLLKPARDSLFLVKVSPEQLPLVFIITALITAPVVLIYSKASNKLHLNKLILYTIGIIILNLIILRWLVQINHPSVYYIFYAWVSIYGALTTSQFWLVANTIYDASQAKRIFSLLGIAGILGAFTGGEVTSIFVQTFSVSTENLLLFCIGFLIILGLLVSMIWSMKSKGGFGHSEASRHGKKSSVTMKKSFAALLHSRHLMLMVGIVAITMMTASFVDYQFKTISFEFFPDESELTSFLGRFYGRLSLVSLLLQLVFAYRVIRFLGVGGVIMFLPITLLVGSVTMFIIPGLIAVVFLRGADGSLKYSLDKTGRELLMLPLSLEVKKRTKIFLDMFVDRWFRGIAGGLLLFCTLVLQLSIRQLSFVVIVFLIIWLTLVVLMRKEYLNSFRKAIEGRSIDLSGLKTGISDASTIGTLINSLASPTNRQVLYALEMLKSVKITKLQWPSNLLLSHKSTEVRVKALELLQIHDNGSDISDVQNMITDPDITIRQEAIYYLCNRSEANRSETLKEFLLDTNIYIRNAAIAAVARHGDSKDANLVDTLLLQSVLNDLSEAAVEGKVQLARLLGTIKKPEFYPFLEKLLDDSSSSVVSQAIFSLGVIKDLSYIPWLIDKLNDKEFRPDARNALGNYGSEILKVLHDYLIRKNQTITVRINILRILSEIPNQESVDILVEHLKTVEPELKFQNIKALNRLREKSSNLIFKKMDLNARLIEETKKQYEISNILYSGRNYKKDLGIILLQRALSERLNEKLEQIFRLLGLIYPSKDIYNAYQGIVSGQRELQANAIEFLDTLLKAELKKYILPIVDKRPSESIISIGKELFNIKPVGFSESLAGLIQGEDRWLRACAIYATREIDSEPLEKLIKIAADDSDELINKTASYVLSLRNRRV